MKSPPKSAVAADARALNASTSSILQNFSLPVTSGPAGLRLPD